MKAYNLPITRENMAKLYLIIEKLFKWELVDGIYVDENKNKLKCGDMFLTTIDKRGRDIRGKNTQTFNPLLNMNHMDLIIKYFPKLTINTSRSADGRYVTRVWKDKEIQGEEWSEYMQVSQLFALINTKSIDKLDVANYT